MTEYSLADFVGNVGVLLILVAYVLLQFERIDSRRVPYSVMNAAGAMMILFSLYFDFNLSAFVIEFFWLLISLAGIARSLFRKESKAYVDGR